MRRRFLPNRRWVGWLLSIAFVLMTLSSEASWQCLDGHACPPGCTMQHTDGDVKHASMPRACCLLRNSKGTGAVHCALCAGAGPEYARGKERCTSPICVLRVKQKPEISRATPAYFAFDLDTNTILLPIPAPVLIPEEMVPLSFGSPRAPPERIVVRPSSPRAPPVLLA